MSPLAPLGTEQLTAYALGEGTTAERAALAARIAADPQAQAELAAISEAAELLNAGLAAESAESAASGPGLDPARRDALARLASQPPARARIRFPHRVVWPGVLAAGLLVTVMAVSRGPRTGTGDAPGQAASPMLALREEQVARKAEAAERTARGADKDVLLAKRDDALAAQPAAAPAPAAPPAPTAFSAPAAPTALAAPAEAGAPSADVAVLGAAAEAKTATPTAPTRAAAKPGAARTLADAAGAAEADGAPAPVEPLWHIAATTMADTTTTVLGAMADARPAQALQQGLTAGHLPPPATVLTRDLVAAFAYATSADHADAVALRGEVGPAPWNPRHRVLRLALAASDAGGVSGVQVQVLFDPGAVRAWRRLDAGQPITAAAPSGAPLTLLYEVEPTAAAPLAEAGAPATALSPAPAVVPAPAKPTSPAAPPPPISLTGVLATVTVRWPRTAGDLGQLVRALPRDGGTPPTADQRFAVAVAEAALALRHVPGPWSLERAHAAAQAAAGDDPARWAFAAALVQARVLTEQQTVVVPHNLGE